MPIEITRPMLAKQADLMALEFPICATPKIDGIRCLILNGVAYSRSMKPIRNKVIQNELAGLPSGLDGELISETNTFQDSTSVVMSEESSLPWKYQVFDFVDTSAESIKPFATRMRDLREMFEQGQLSRHCEILFPEFIYAMSDLTDLCEQHLLEGFEGTMLRKPESGYKCGRSTVREGLLLKVKAFEDAEAVVIGFEELQHNLNEATTNELGLTERSSHKENQVAGDTLGALVVHMNGDPSLEFKIGTGFTQEQRAEFWHKKDELLGSLVKFKHFPQGVKRLPRHPVFLGFRHTEDM